MDHSYETFFEDDTEAALVTDGVIDEDGSAHRAWFDASRDRSEQAVEFGKAELEKLRERDAFLQEVREGYGDRVPCGTA